MLCCRFGLDFFFFFFKVTYPLSRAVFFLEVKRAIYSVLGMMRFLAFMRFSLSRAVFFLEIKRAIYSVLGMMRFLAFMRFSFTFFTTLTHCYKCSEFGYTFCFITQVYFNFSIPCFSLGVYVWIWMYV